MNDSGSDWNFLLPTVTYFRSGLNGEATAHCITRFSELQIGSVKHAVNDIGIRKGFRCVLLR